MKNLTYVLAAGILLLCSCNKKNTDTPEPDFSKPTLDVQTDYRLKEVYRDGRPETGYEYNDDLVIIKKNRHYYYKPFHGAGELTEVVEPLYYHYDSLIRLNNSLYDYKYDDRKLIERYSSAYNVILDKYEYKNNRLSHYTEYDVNGKLVAKTSYKHDANGNLVEKIIEYPNNYNTTFPNPVPVRAVITYTDYDDANNIRFAMAGLHNIQFDGGLSMNNPGKEVYIQSMSDGSTLSNEISYTYEYNAGKFPVKMIRSDKTGTFTSTYTYYK